MSANSLLNADENLTELQNKTKKTIIYTLSGIFLIAALVGAYWFLLKPAAKTAKRVNNQYSSENLRNSVVMFLAQPQFSGSRFAEQILGRAQLALYQMDKKEVYFSLPEMPEVEAQNVLSKFIIDQSKIEKGTIENSRMRLGNYTLKHSPEKSILFKTALQNFKVDPETILSFDFKRAKYTLSLRELVDFSSNAKLFGGRLNADANMRRSDGKIVVFANHGSFVAKPNEPSLQRLANDLLQNLPSNSAISSREQKIQKLLDFVSNEIEYDYSEALSGYETLKRADETLMSRTADCSNKTILLASLLEQIGEDYLLLYCPEHITVAVLQGNFPAQNRLTFVWDNKNYVIAESTLANFKIGETSVQEMLRLKSVQYVQIPRYRDVIFDASTMHPVGFH